MKSTWVITWTEGPAHWSVPCRAPKRTRAQKAPKQTRPPAPKIHAQAQRSQKPRPQATTNPLTHAKRAPADAQRPPAPRRTQRRRAASKGVLVLTLCAAALGTSLVAEEAHAQRRKKQKLVPADVMLKQSVSSKPLVLIGALALLSLLPFVIIMVTSFVKISVVLSIVRTAMGTQQIPPTQVITGLAIILTVYIMAPVGLQIYNQSRSIIDQRNQKASFLSAETMDLVIDAAARAKDPMTAFLTRHSHAKDRAMFIGMAKRLRRSQAERQSIGSKDLMIVIPAFVISELKEAFQIGFIIFVPFLVIDMIVANILMALGMQMLSPTTISLPFKILLFVMIDGWYLITKGLITGYV